MGGDETRSQRYVQVLGSIIGGILNFVVANNVLTANREILLDVQGSNVWSGQQIQSYNTGAYKMAHVGKDGR